METNNLTPDQLEPFVRSARDLFDLAARLNTAENVFRAAGRGAVDDYVDLTGLPCFGGHKPTVEEIVDAGIYARDTHGRALRYDDYEWGVRPDLA